MIVNETLIRKAEALKPGLHKRTVTVRGNGRILQKGDSEVFDFGTHLTGNVSLDFSYEGHHPDAPVLLNLQFAEHLRELDEDVTSYRGWICSGWVQQERIRLESVPGRLQLPGRYAFRYLRIAVEDISGRFGLKAERVSCEAATSADEERLGEAEFHEELLKKIDETACRTLKECMQEVFEDGPKRDRRLWLGDLRLQALTNAVTYRNFDLVKRCLYLFAGTSFDDGRIAACVFTEPEAAADDTYMFDYALLFIRALKDYYAATNDRALLEELWPAAKRQIEAAAAFFAEDGLIREPEEKPWCFIDWNLELDKQASAHGVFLYCLDAAAELAAALDDAAFLEKVRKLITEKRAAGRKLYDEKLGLFVSGPRRQISMASQVWAVLGGLTEDAAVLERAAAAGALKMVSPYMHHYCIEALICLGKKAEALDLIRKYWGGMIENGADTFWELYDPEDPERSPYGGSIVNSYCHAWSCTPAYFLRSSLAEQE